MTRYDTDLLAMHAELESHELATKELRDAIACEEAERASGSRIIALLGTRGGTRVFEYFSPVAQAQREARGAMRSYGHSKVAEGKGFHWRGGLYFSRERDGAVVIADWRPIINDIGEHLWTGYAAAVIPANEWASIVASVSVSGETSERYEQARSFHGKTPP